MMAAQRPCCRPFSGGSASGSSRLSSGGVRRPTLSSPPSPTRAQQQQQPQDQSAAGGGDPSTPSSSYEFTYRGSDGRLKATFEQAFKTGQQQQGGGGGSSGEGNAPWALGYQMSERYSMLWNDDLKRRLLLRKAADELQMAEEEVESRLARVQLLLPDIGSKLPSMRPQLVARLAADVELLPARLLALKAVFPGADASLLAMRQPELVLGFDAQRLQAIAEELRQLLPALNIDLMVQHNPGMLDVPGLRAAMEEAARIMPQLDVQAQMGADPSMILGFQRGSQLIPYDPPRPTTPEEAAADDDEYGAYYGGGV